MSTTHVRAIRCPVCSATAQLVVDWSDETSQSHARVRRYRCPNGCDIDDATLHQLIGAQ